MRFLVIVIFFFVCLNGLTIVAQSSENVIYDEQASFKFPSVSYVEWSPDGTRLAVATFPNIVIINRDTWNVELLISNAEVTEVSWSPDGTRIASVQGGTNEKLIIWDSSSGEELKRIIRPNSLNSNQVRIYRLYGVQMVHKLSAIVEGLISFFGM